MTVEFIGPVIPLRVEGHNASLRFIRDSRNNIEAASILSSPEAQPPYVQLSLISPPGPHYKEICEDKVTKLPQPNRARLMIRETFSADTLVSHALKRISQSRHPAGRSIKKDKNS